MNILFVSSEAIPFAKTGGLADVAGILPRKMAKTENVFLVLPDYQTGATGQAAAEVVDRFLVKIRNWSVPVIIKRISISKKFKVLFINQDLFFARKFLYGDSSGDYPDNFYRFLFFQLAVVEFVRREKFSFDIIHVNDWQTALIPMFLNIRPVEAGQKRGITFLTIHNLGYQGAFDIFYFREMGIPDWLNSSDYLEFYGMINFLKGGIVFSDRILTVSPTYAREILTPEMGFGLDGLLRKCASKLSGILNGVDDSLWNPVNDPFIFQNYSSRSLSKKQMNKTKLFEELGFGDPRIPLVVTIARLAAQKGIELLLDALPELMKKNLFFVVLGTGDRVFEEKLKKLGAKFKTKMRFLNCFDERMAHWLEAAGDIFLMPSLYEPCGLNQMYSLKYGTVPVVHATGGLNDTVDDFDLVTQAGNGFKFKETSCADLVAAVGRALEFYPDKKTWRVIQRNGMKADFSWDRVAKNYLSLYKQSLNEEKPDGRNYIGQ